MGLKLAAGAVGIILVVLFLQGCLFGGSDDKGNTPASVSRPSSIPTATPPANLPEPVVLGSREGSAVTSAGTTGGGSTAGSGNSYTVQSGDTLGAIATSLGVTAEQQAAWIADVLRLNAIADARLLSAGQVLQLPRIAAAATATPSASGTPSTTRTPAASGSTTPTRTPTAQPAGPTATSPAATATPRATSTPGSTASGGGGTYTVLSGDYPFLIAGKLGIPESRQDAWVNDLVSLNNISPTGLSVGQVLKLPANSP